MSSSAVISAILPFSMRTVTCAVPLTRFPVASSHVQQPMTLLFSPVSRSNEICQSAWLCPPLL